MKMAFKLLIVFFVCACGPSLSRGREWYQPLPQVNPGACSEEPSCNSSSQYRTMDGSCSSADQNHTSWGQAGRTYLRTMPANYQGKDQPRTSVCNATLGQSLPNTRQLSLELLKQKDKCFLDKHNTLLGMAMGQFIAHDFTNLDFNISLAFIQGECCTEDHKMRVNPPPSPQCMAIEISKDDRFYSKHNVECIHWVRANSADDKTTCNSTKAHPVNLNSPVLDGSAVYGSDDETANILRSGINGEMKVNTTDEGDFLPAGNPLLCPGNRGSETVCYNAGDARVNLNPSIVVLTTAFVRVHNEIARELHRLNPCWEDERLYQETRRIVVAIIQRVTYKSYLPLLLGEDFMYTKGLWVKNATNCTDYHIPVLNPSIWIEFAGSAFRVFHAMVTKLNRFYQYFFKPISSIDIAEHYFRPSFVQQKGLFIASLFGLANQAQQQQEACYTTAFTNELIKFNKPFGRDLKAIDFNRSRDLGLPTYNQVQELCGYKKFKSFKDLRSVMSNFAIKKLKEAYSCIDDVDLFAGGLVETEEPGTLLGPTFRCIIADQFYVLMKGDRFYYENCGPHWTFTPAQRKVIENFSMSTIFCLASNGAIQNITENVFLQPDKKNNPILPCPELPDLNAFKEECS